jgi:hypothetical protein
MPFQDDLVVVDSIENLGCRSGASRGLVVSNWVRWAQFERCLIGCGMFSSSSTWKSWFRFAQFDWERIKHRIKEESYEAAIALAIEVRAGFDHVGGI